MTAYDLIIFDCDGTLVDTEHLCNKVIADLLAEEGFPQYNPVYTLEHFVGMTLDEVVATVEKETGHFLPPDFIDRYERGVNEQMAAELRFIEGVSETLAALEGKIKICIASNGERSNVLESLRHAGLSRYFNDAVVFTKNMVKQGKPAPDLILLAARAMGVDPVRALLVDDSVAGATAGFAAGTAVAGLTATYHDKTKQERALRAAGAHYVTDRFSDIPRIAGL